ncbi:MAG: tRNA lysidine(34) synthetase TilS [Bacillota bacterium]
MAAPILDRIRRFIEENHLLSPGDRVGVAVSGGVDSVCLLHLLRELEDYRLDLLVFHIDHGLRPESPEEAAFVQELAGRLGLPFFLGRPAVRAYARLHRLSLEMAARELRYAELRRMAHEAGAVRVALGHHRDDQVETVLLRLVRGTGLEGLAGIPPVREGGLFVRPLLPITRAELRQYAEENGLGWVEDTSNRDTTIFRNRVRHLLLPYLRQEFNPRVDRALLDLAALARETLACLEEKLARRWPELGVEPVPGGLVWSFPAFAVLPPALARLAFRRLFAQVGGDPGRLSFAATERVWRFVQGTGGPRLSIPGGLLLERRHDLLFLGRRRPLPSLIPQELPVPGSLALPDGRRLIAAWWTGNLPAWTDVGKDEAFLDADAIVWPLWVRSRRPGDRFYPLGLGGSKKVKEFLIEAKVAREEREAVPVVVDGLNRIVWLAGLRPDERFRIRDDTQRVLHLCLRWT